MFFSYKEGVMDEWRELLGVVVMVWCPGCLLDIGVPKSLMVDQCCPECRGLLVGKDELLVGELPQSGRY